MDKNLKIKLQNYHDSKTIIASNIDKKDTVTTFINRDLNDHVWEIV